MNKKIVKIFLFFLVFISDAYAFEMIKIPEITFTRTDKAGNQQEVTVSSFYMSKQDVTVDEWFDYLDSSFETKTKWRFNYCKKDYSSTDQIEHMKYILSEMGFINQDTIIINNEWPIFDISCTEALYYCNYLSEKEGLELCYEWIDDGSENGRVILNPKANGYRLPTLSEWQAVSCIYTDEITEEYLMETNNLNIQKNFSKDKKPNKYGLVDIISNYGKFLWDYYDEDEMYLNPKVRDPLGSDKYTPDWNAVHYNEPIYETRFITVYFDEHKLPRLDRFLNSPVSWITVNESVSCTIRLCRNKECNTYQK